MSGAPLPPAAANEWRSIASCRHCLNSNFLLPTPGRIDKSIPVSYAPRHNLLSVRTLPSGWLGSRVQADLSRSGALWKSRQGAASIVQLIGLTGLGCTMSRGSDRQHSSHLPLLPGFLPPTPIHSCNRLAEALARQKSSWHLQRTR